MLLRWRMYAKALRHAYRNADEERAYLAGFQDAWNEDTYGASSYSKVMWPAAYSIGYHEGSLDLMKVKIEGSMPLDNESEETANKHSLH